MRRPVRRLSRPRTRTELDATAVPTWRPPRVASADPASLAFVLAPGRLPRGRRVYAIGDIHGCLAELRLLHAAIATDLVVRPPVSAVLVHLGDYIDFGPDSAGVLGLLAEGPPIAGLVTVNLMGDHERTALDALSGDGAAATDWLHTGGEATLASWGIDADLPRSDWRARVPAGHLELMRGLGLEHTPRRPARSAGRGRHTRHSPELPRERTGFWCDHRARPFREPHAHHQTQPHRPRYRRRLRRQAHLCGVRGRRNRIHVGVTANRPQGAGRYTRIAASDPTSPARSATYRRSSCGTNSDVRAPDAVRTVSSACQDESRWNTANSPAPQLT